jgi:hypothetical protein
MTCRCSIGSRVRASTVQITATMKESVLTAGNDGSMTHGVAPRLQE